MFIGCEQFISKKKILVNTLNFEITIFRVAVLKFVRSRRGNVASFTAAERSHRLFHAPSLCSRSAF